jgi:hypothetical protein
MIKKRSAALAAHLCMMTVLFREARDFECAQGTLAERCRTRPQLWRNAHAVLEPYQT